MANTITKYIVSHRSGCGLCPSEIFDSYEDCIAYIEDELAMFVRDYVYSEYGDESEEYKEIEDLTNEDVVLWGEEHDLICDKCFTGYGDWEEFGYNSVEIALTPDRNQTLSDRMSIVRNGSRIQLTEDELVEAYSVQNHLHKIQDIMTLLESGCYFGEVWYQSLSSNQDFIEDAAYKLEEYDNKGCAYEYALAQALEDTVSRYLNEEQERD